ncbi:MAG: terminase large subunit [Bacteroidota bacterium]
MYQETTAAKRIKALTKPIRVIKGGQGAGKTIALELLMIGACQHQPLECTIFQAELTKLKKTAMRDFFKIMKSGGMWNDRNWKAGENIYHFNTGGYIEFVGLDKVDLGKGFRRDIVYFNEINRGGLTLDGFVQIAGRSKVAYADLNPDIDFWLDREIIPQDDCETLRLTFEDNEYCPANEKRTILSYLERGFYDTTLSVTELFDKSNIKHPYWANKWRVYGLGLTGLLEGVVFSNCRICHRVPKDAKYICSGMDFGHNDPWTLVDMYQYNGQIIFDLVFYEKGLSLSDAAKLSKQDFKRIIYCDPSRPDTRDELRRYGVNVYSAKTGKDSINLGIELLQEQEHFFITKRSKEMIEEFKRYKWKEDKQGDTMDVPIDAHNHTVDPARYCALSSLKKNSGQYHVI